MLSVNSSSPLLLLRVQITTRQLLCTERGWGWHRKSVTVPWSHLTQQSLCPEHTQGNRGFPAKSLQADLSKAGSRTRAALQDATCQHSLVEEVVHRFQNLLALVLNVSYKEEGLQYYRICSKILTVLSSSLKTSQQPVLQVANASTKLCTRVRIETLTVLKLEVSVSSKTALGQQAWPQSSPALGHLENFRNSVSTGDSEQTGEQVVAALGRSISHSCPLKGTNLMWLYHHQPIIGCVNTPPPPPSATRTTLTATSTKSPLRGGSRLAEPSEPASHPCQHWVLPWGLGWALPRAFLDPGVQWGLFFAGWQQSFTAH